MHYSRRTCNTNTNTTWALVAPVPVAGCTPPPKKMFYGPLCIIMITQPVTKEYEYMTCENSWPGNYYHMLCAPKLNGFVLIV